MARNDLDGAADAGRRVVQHGQAEFDSRYRREYLTSEKFRGFDEALVRLLELLELPGVGKVLSGALCVLRTPYRLLKGLVGKALSRPEAASRPEQPVLEDALTGWIDLLRKEAARRADDAPALGARRRGLPRPAAWPSRPASASSRTSAPSRPAWPTRSSARPGPSTRSWKRTRSC